MHPYKGEISKLLKNPDIGFLEFLDGFDNGGEKWNCEMSDPLVWTETKSQLEELAEVLSKERVFAVDTEQHGLRSFLGFTALIQVQFSIAIPSRVPWLLAKILQLRDKLTLFS